MCALWGGAHSLATCERGHRLRWFYLGSQLPSSIHFSPGGGLQAWVNSARTLAKATRFPTLGEQTIFTTSPCNRSIPEELTLVAIAISTQHDGPIPSPQVGPPNQRLARLCPVISTSTHPVCTLSLCVASIADSHRVTLADWFYFFFRGGSVKQQASRGPLSVSRVRPSGQPQNSVGGYVGTPM